MKKLDLGVYDISWVTIYEKAQEKNFILETEERHRVYNEMMKKVNDKIIATVFGALGESRDTESGGPR